MITTVLTSTLHAISRRGDGKIDVFLTVFVQGQTATATIALSAFTNGEENGHLGVATAIITKAGVVTSPGHTDTLPLDPIDVHRNQMRIPNCSFVTFRMGVEMAEAIAVATVFVEGEAMKTSMSTRSAWIVERATGRITGIHKIEYPTGTPRPSDALVLRRVRQCAALASGVDVRLLKTLIVSTQPKLIEAGLVVNRSSGRVERRSPGRGIGESRLKQVLRSGSLPSKR
jgi:hypothetical protein